MDRPISKGAHLCYFVLHTFWMFFISIFLHTTAFAQSKATLSFETDPLVFVLQGYGGHIKVTHEALKHWEFGIGGAFSVELPDAFNNINQNNKNQGWTVQMRKGYGLFSEYYLDAAIIGWFMGSQVMFQEFRIKNSATGPDHSDFTTFMILAHTGYRWFPFKNGFFAKPWIGIGYQTKIQGGANLGEKTYDIFNILPFVSVHLGYRF